MIWQLVLFLYTTLNFGEILLCLIPVFFLCSFIKILYDRCFRIYKKEINLYLQTLGFEYVITKNSISNNCKNSPFSKPPIEFSFIIVRPIFLRTKVEYKIIIAQRKDIYQEFWLKITTGLLYLKPKLEFSQGKKIKRIEN